MTNLEARLRAALSARALSVSADDLQPAVPPTLATVPKPRRLAWPWAGALAGGVAVALVAGFVAARLPGDDGTGPAPNPPAATVPSQQSSSSPSSSPEASPGISPGVSPEPGPARGSDGLPKGRPEASPGSARSHPPVPVSPGAPEPSTAPSPPAAFG
ncbi:hypothetical protein ACPCHT_11670 [Nucisporomicrobium flavum]|uniref:hypothetical protein n=1 Tax=Nucisporomicrobium flavum TaxID=2785915 RepID=UPI0018F72C91|nr:hypothetical protein [Nucisporomicrobium flavum]